VLSSKYALVDRTLTSLLLPRRFFHFNRKKTLDRPGWPIEGWTEANRRLAICLSRKFDACICTVQDQTTAGINPGYVTETAEVRWNLIGRRGDSGGSDSAVAGTDAPPAPPIAASRSGSSMNDTSSFSHSTFPASPS